MSRAEQAIFTNLCMVYDDAGNILVQDRQAQDWPGICFPGGHVERNESFVRAAIREVYEETGVSIKNPKYRGIITFVSDVWGTEFMHLFTATEFDGEINYDCNEGKLEWVKKEIIPTLPIWEGDKIFFRLMESFLRGHTRLHRETWVYLAH